MGHSSCASKRTAVAQRVTLSFDNVWYLQMVFTGFPDWPLRISTVHFKVTEHNTCHFYPFLVARCGKHIATVGPTQALKVVSTGWSSTVFMWNIVQLSGCFDASVSYGISWRSSHSCGIWMHLTSFDLINFFLNCDQGLLSQPLHGAEVSVLELKTSNKIWKPRNVLQFCNVQSGWRTFCQS